MNRRTALKAALAAPAALLCLNAQEGHPLTGTWHGSWGTGADPKSRTDCTLVMNWDGTNVTGMLNPGLRVAQLQKTSFTPSTWMFHFEADYKDRSGKVERVVVDAKIEDVTHPRRQLIGTYTLGTAKGDFKAQRDN